MNCTCRSTGGWRPPYSLSQDDMNEYQQTWWEQARSDHGVFVVLRRNGASACHQLHYLQMTTEKLGKAYFWRSGNPHPRTHACFVQYLRALGGIRQSERHQIADAFAFGRFDDFQKWVRAILPLAYELQRLAPALANDGPNPEYPWPQDSPLYVPATFDFDVWRQLRDTGRGRQLLRVIDLAVDKFPIYG
jgi:hypothetical protein